MLVPLDTFPARCKFSVGQEVNMTGGSVNASYGSKTSVVQVYLISEKRAEFSWFRSVSEEHHLSHDLYEESIEAVNK